MENDFRLSIKNTQRKIGDVRDLFCNLTSKEKLTLEKEKILSELKQNILYNSTNIEIENKMAAKCDDNENNVPEIQQQNEYELRVMNVYNRFASEANEDFGKYLDDDDDDDGDDGEDRKSNEENKNNLKTKSSSFGKNSTRPDSKKLKKYSSPDQTQSAQTQSIPKRVDMCGLHALEKPPSKQKIEPKYQPHQQQNVSNGALSGLKNKIKNLFSNKDDQKYGTYIDVDATTLQQQQQQYYQPRTIQALQYESSKIGYSSGQTYEQYYTNVDELRNFDQEARINNFKYNPNGNHALMDDSLNLHYTHMHPCITKHADNKNIKKNKSLNSKFAALLSKVKPTKEA